MITSQNRPGLPAFMRVTLKTRDGLGTRLAFFTSQLHEHTCMHIHLMNIIHVHISIKALKCKTLGAELVHALHRTSIDSIKSFTYS